MPLTKQTVIDKIEILETGHVQVRRATYIVEDGRRLPHPTYHRIAYAPGADITAEAVQVQAHCVAAWTPGVLAAHQARMLAEKLGWPRNVVEEPL